MTFSRSYAAISCANAGAPKHHGRNFLPGVSAKFLRGGDRFERGLIQRARFVFDEYEDSVAHFFRR